MHDQNQGLGNDDTAKHVNNSIQRPVRTLARKGTRKASKAVSKPAKILAKNIFKAFIGLVGPPGIFFLFVIILVLVLFFGVYGGMTEESMLTDSNKQGADSQVEKYAKNRADKSNIFNTWVVSGEASKNNTWQSIREKYENHDELYQNFKGGYRPPSQNSDGQNIKTSNIGYDGSDMPGWTFLGRLADNEGKEALIINQWGDVYAPILFHALEFNSDNFMQKGNYREENFNESAFELKPYFYYKTSTITVTSKDKEGKETTETYDIYLLVEAYTIRGHNLYHYKEQTTTEGNTTITREVLNDVESIDDGRPYLTKYLEKKLKLEAGAEESTMVGSVWEAMEGFTAKSQWMDWLIDNGFRIASLVSAAGIPAEYKAMLEEASRLTGIPTWLLAGIIMKESSWDFRVSNPSTGCFGLTQLNPKYWPAWAARYGFDANNDKWNPRAQIIVGAYVLKGYFPSMPNWDGSSWYKDLSFRNAMAKYGGYGNDVNGSAGYINEIVALAKGYRSPTTWPVIGYRNITSPFGDRHGKLHGGIDIGCPTGTQIVSVSSGLVTAAGWNSGYGYYIEISDMNYIYLYAHLSKLLISKGETVSPGQTIARSGNTGSYSEGSHLHFGISVLGGDPKSYRGAIDPLTVLK